MDKNRKAILVIFGFMLFLVVFLIGVFLLATYLLSTLSPIKLYDLWTLLMGYSSIYEISFIDLFFIGLFTFIGGVFAFSIIDDLKRRSQPT
jgi:hypothetical protein